MHEQRGSSGIIRRNSGFYVAKYTIQALPHLADVSGHGEMTLSSSGRGRFAVLDVRNGRS